MSKGKIAGGVFKIGNIKLDKSILIFNITSAENCPARKLGLCSVEKICYARSPEKLWPNVLKYRKRQAEYWDSHSWIEIYHDIKAILKNRPYIKYFRLNEAGDFKNQEDVIKADCVAACLTSHGIKTYAYTARHDLDFSNIQFIRIRLSGTKKTDFNSDLPKAIVIEHKTERPKGFHLCPGKGCGNKCKYCPDTKGNVAFLIHGKHKSF